MIYIYIYWYCYAWPCYINKYITIYDLDMPDKMRADDFIQRDYAQHIRLTPQRRNQQLITFINKLIR